jgi:hypothetical protein
MSKYSQQIIDAVAKGDMKRPGVLLGAACIDAGIPVQVVAKWLGLSRQGVYFWFTGETEVAERNRTKVDKITSVLLAGLDAGELPAKDLATALEVVKKYRSKKHANIQD